jgi:hypothetical protein
MSTLEGPNQGRPGGSAWQEETQSRGTLHAVSGNPAARAEVGP